MLCAAIKDSPVFGGKVKSYDEAAIANRPGFRKVVKYKDNAVVVVADTWWHSKTALDALPIVWDEGPNANESDATIAARLKEGLTATETNGSRQNGDALKAIAEAPKKVEAVYSTPFLAHACMEPMNCTARITADKGEVWVATQNAEASLAALSKASGLPLEKCEVYRSDLGGGFGRRGGAQDYVHQAVAKRIWRMISSGRSPCSRVLPASTPTATWSGCICACPASQLMPSPIRPRSKKAGTCASFRAITRMPAMPNSATACRTC
jgi:isoquinoline 1-oxidoreductase beta subunit